MFMNTFIYMPSDTLDMFLKNWIPFIWLTIYYLSYYYDLYVYLS